MTSGFAQGIAGSDKILCAGGTVQLGTPGPAYNGCCWKWAPTNGLSDATAATPLVSGLASTTEYTLVVISGGKKCGGCVQTSGPGNTDQFTIKNASGKSNLVIPITIMDDDDIPWGGTSMLIQPLTFSATKTAFDEVYIDAVNDGGGNLMNNKANVRFSRNVNDGFKSDSYSKDGIESYNKERESSSWERDNYWCVYILSAWQYITSKDKDPEDEVSSLGATNSEVLDCDLSRGGNISIMFHEAIADSNTDIEIACTHEIGHQFGLSHGKGPGDTGSCASCVLYSCFLKNMGIMKSSTPLPSYFILYHKHIIRSRSKSPGTN